MIIFLWVIVIVQWALIFIQQKQNEDLLKLNKDQGSLLSKYADWANDTTKAMKLLADILKGKE
jgi:hypothetical protein